MAKSTIKGTTRADEAGRGESQPWTLFYRAGEAIRRLRSSSKEEVDAGTEAEEQPESRGPDHQAALRMLDEGCPNEHPATHPHGTAYCGMGGRLLLVGSPIF